SDPLQLHCQLGHLNLSTCKRLCPHFMTLNELFCESCQFTKHHRVSYSPRVSELASAPFEIVHSDVWGPSPVISQSGFCYFVIFGDDYSRTTWLYLMKNRSDLFSIFCSFCSEINTQYSTTIRILRSDNAKEYLSSSFQSFMIANDIRHQ